MLGFAAEALRLAAFQRLVSSRAVFHLLDSRDQMRVIDCCPYNGEPIALFRLAYLYDFVDDFLLIEARETFAGNVKEELWSDRNAELLRPYEEKISRLVIERFPEPAPETIQELRRQPYVVDPHVWFREIYQRDFAGPYLKQMALEEPWVVLSCDIDEIPRRELVKQLRDSYQQLDQLVRLEMKFHNYSSRWVKLMPCDQSIAINDRGFAASNCTLTTLRRHVRAGYLCKDAGWHLSYFMPADDIVRKVTSFAHQEFNTERFRSAQWLRDRVATGRDLFDRGGYEDCVPYAGRDLPEGLLEFETAHGIGAA